MRRCQGALEKNGLEIAKDEESRLFHESLSGNYPGLSLPVCVDS